ncbi:MAG TPA: CocE/NonD family hydrolase [Arenimonas sp.]|nr:CocE/NonD family hydrolase [Arenimonas sp.]
MTFDFPAHNSTFFLPGPAGKIEAMLELPAFFGLQSPVVLICHPHPPDGGTMNNKVVTTIAKAFIESGFISLRFNFRSVGQSEGIYDHGRGELLDCLAVLDWLRKVRPGAAIALAGFSFGSWVALKAIESINPMLMVSIAPPVGFRDFADVRHPNCPWLAIQGMSDEVVDADTVVSWLEQQNPVPDIIAMEDTSHFFHGKLVPLRAHISAFLNRFKASINA